MSTRAHINKIRRGATGKLNRDAIKAGARGTAHMILGILTATAVLVATAFGGFGYLQLVTRGLRTEDVGQYAAAGAILGIIAGIVFIALRWIIKDRLHVPPSATWFALGAVGTTAIGAATTVPLLTAWLIALTIAAALELIDVTMMKHRGRKAGTTVPENQGDAHAAA